MTLTNLIVRVIFFQKSDNLVLMYQLKSVPLHRF